jgi:RimJ/RimL family protein N-acetyltransferase
MVRGPGRALHIVLRDGTRALIRPIRSDDKDRLVSGFERLSPRSRYMRFHMHIDELSPEQLRYLTEVDGRDHVAWVALNEGDPDQPGMGVARYVRVSDEPDIAEAAITVVDDYQGRGLGTVLLGVLAATARENGVTTFRNYVLAENEAMIGLLDELGAVLVPEGDGVHRLDLPIPEDPDDLPDTSAGRTLRAAAAGRLRMLVSAITPVRLPAEASAPVGGDPDVTEVAPGSPLLDEWAEATFGADVTAAEDDGDA